MIELPVGIRTDIDECFCYSDDITYQTRAHEYLERYEINRGYRDTAIQACVTDIARRAFEAGLQGSVADIGPELRASMLETAAMLIRTAGEVE